MRAPAATGIGAYFEALEQRFHAAAESGVATRPRRYRIAGQTVDVRFAGNSLFTSLTPALAHLEDGCAETARDGRALTIMAWDQASAIAAIPRPPWNWENYLSRGEIGGLDTNRFRAWFHVASGVLSIIDLRRGRAIFWVRDASRLPIYVVAAPFRMVLNAWLTRSGLHFAHAAAVGTAAGGVLLAGAGGSGKSTTSLACLNAGMDFLSDDYCIVGARPEARVYSVYCSAKSDEGMLKRFPALIGSRQKRDDPPGEKALLLLNEHHAERMVPGKRLLALLVPTVSDQPQSTLEPIKALAAIRALAPTTMEQIAGPDTATWSTLLALAGQLSCYRLNLGRDVFSSPPLIAGLLADLSGTAS